MGLTIILLVFLFPINNFSQDSPGHKYPQGYFRNPLNIPMSLTANFGELRDSHWHMGLDFRTDSKENFPVFAAADGYVAYVGIRPKSFGKYMIVNHPNGYSTLYAHLNSFYPELEAYVKDQQYKKESWAIELSLPDKMFSIKKSDTIALSGNTGGSQGPHLHFEIRKTKTGHSLNPLLFGFDLKDNVPPVITRLAFYNRNISTYSQTPTLVKIKKTDSGYYTVPPIIQTGFAKISFAIGAVDLVSGSPNPNGVYGAIIDFDDRPQTEFMIDNIDYDQSEYVNAHIDHLYKENSGLYLQHLAPLPGENSNVYQEIDGNGIIELKDTLEHKVRIEVMDANDNLSELFIKIQYKDSLARFIKKTISTQQKFIPNQVNILEQKDFEVYLPEKSLFDTVSSIYYFQNQFLPGSVSANHHLNDPSIPLYENIVIRIKPTVTIPGYQMNNIVIKREWKGNYSVKKAVWQNGWVSATFGDFGNFQAFIDQEPPKIEPPVKQKDTLDFSPLDRIVFTPSDNFGIDSFRAELNGKWMLFSNDKGRNYIYKFDDSFPFGVYELKVKVEDLVGNVTEKKWWFKKFPYTPPAKKKRKNSIHSKTRSKPNTALKKK